ncbi:hypothetical protein C0J52_18794 [Blattella germanica]|nr:hypothetical protein C0J52_18794 [Blattella germanica]
MTTACNKTQTHNLLNIKSQYYQTHFAKNNNFSFFQKQSYSLMLAKDYLPHTSQMQLCMNNALKDIHKVLNLNIECQELSSLKE